MELQYELGEFHLSKLFRIECSIYPSIFDQGIKLSLVILEVEALWGLMEHTRRFAEGKGINSSEV